MYTLPVNLLSPRARHVLSIGIDTYRAIVPISTGPLEARDLLESLKPTELLPAGPHDLNMASAALSGLWLWHDFLDESHTLCQAIETPTGSFWHAIMHRREGDFSNAKYWYRKCSNHPALATIAGRVRPMLDAAPADKSLLKVVGQSFDPFHFVDLAHSVHRNNADPRLELAIAIQRIEWASLFEHCVHNAGRSF
jgi:hypothetical protein